MAGSKTTRTLPCVAHVVLYTLPFWLITESPAALLIIGATHFIIDRFRLAKYICYAKNFLAPKRAWPVWSECSTTGYPDSRPAWLAVWLMIITDNLLHVMINALAIKYC